MVVVLPGAGRSGEDQQALGAAQDRVHLLELRGGEAEPAEPVLDLGALQHPQHDAFAVERRHEGGADVDLAVPAALDGETAVLRLVAYVDHDLRQDLEPVGDEVAQPR